MAENRRVNDESEIVGADSLCDSILMRKIRDNNRNQHFSVSYSGEPVFSLKHVLSPTSYWLLQPKLQKWRWWLHEAWAGPFGFQNRPISGRSSPSAHHQCSRNTYSAQLRKGRLESINKSFRHIRTEVEFSYILGM